MHNFRAMLEWQCVIVLHDSLNINRLVSMEAQQEMFIKELFHYQWASLSCMVLEYTALNILYDKCEY